MIIEKGINILLFRFKDYRRYSFIEEHIDKLLPPVSRFGGGGARAKKKKTVIEKLMGYFEKYSGLGVVAFKAKQEEDKVITYDFAKTPVYMVAEEPAEYGKKED